MGTVLEVSGQPETFIAEAITVEDATRLDFEIGQCQGQAAAEALAALVALRMWLPRWSTARSAVTLRSGSTAALGALGKMASPAPPVNTVAREVALDVALSRYGIDVWTHISAEYNKEADALSRVSAPRGTLADVPNRL